VEEEEEPKEGEEPKAEVLVWSFWISVLYFRFSNVLSIWSVLLLSYQGDTNKTKKTKTEKYWDWELANETKPIWVSLSYYTCFDGVGMPISCILPLIY